MINLDPIAFVRNSRQDLTDDNWGSVVSEIVLLPDFGEDSIRGLEDFSHAEIVFHFHRVTDDEIVSGARHPRGNRSWPLVGIFAQRGKARPNRLGLAIVRIVSRTGSVLTVRDLDAIDGTPILDIKPLMREFLPVGEVRQPEWATELMKDYWKP